MLIEPTLFDLPPSFSDFRDGQLSTAFSIVTSPQPFHIIQAATGTGKSFINVLTHLLNRKMLPGIPDYSVRSIYLTDNKGLQDQLQHEFEPCGMYLMRGANNYRCPIHGNCDYGGISECSYRRQIDGLSDCSYLAAKDRTMLAPLVNSNFAYILALAANDDSLGSFHLTIADEAHKLLDVLTKFSTINLTDADCRDYLSVQLPQFSDVSTWSQWAYTVIDAYREKFKLIRKHLRLIDRIKMEKFGKTLRGIVDISYEPDNWLSTVSTPESIELTPVWPKRQAAKLLFGKPSRENKILFSSATFNQQSASYLGVNQSDINLIDLPSKFSVERRPFYIIPEAKIDFRLSEGELIKLMRYIERVYFEPRLQFRIIIHSRSYEWARRIIAASKPEFRAIMITHRPGDKGGTRAFAEWFFSTAPPVIAVTPDMHTGYDLKDDRARYQLIWKCPTMDSRDLLTKARIKTDSTYKPNLEAADLEQNYGRGMRHPDDWCETVTFDKNMSDWFLKTIRPYCPRHFVDSWQFTKTVPRPLHERIDIR